LRPIWNATFLTPTPTGAGEQTFEDELTRIRHTSAETARTDLATALEAPLPSRLHRPDLPAIAAELLD
jgi:hypothetical protein